MRFGTWLNLAEHLIWVQGGVSVQIRSFRFDLEISKRENLAMAIRAGQNDDMGLGIQSGRGLKERSDATTLRRQAKATIRKQTIRG